jgi:hypothetical protein
LAVLPFAAAPAPVAAAAAPAGIGPCTNFFQRETVIVYEIVGTISSGYVDRQLVVYSSGSARISDASSFGPPGGRAASAYVGPDQVTSMLAKLTAQGAFQLCDLPFITPVEIPLHTLMIQQPGTDSMSRNASWRVATGAHGEVQRTLERFVAHAFPGF